MAGQLEGQPGMFSSGMWSMLEVGEVCMGMGEGGMSSLPTHKENF